MPWALLVAAGLALVLGGDFRHFASIRIRAWWLLGLALGLKLALLWSGAPPTVWAQPLIFVLVAAGAAANWRLTGVRLVALGLLLNAAAVAANGGVMPYSLASAALAGRSPAGQATGSPKATALSVPETDASRLIWLDDRVPFPPNRDLLSVGDVAVIAGCFGLVIGLSRPRRLRCAFPGAVAAEPAG